MNKHFLFQNILRCRFSLKNKNTIFHVEENVYGRNFFGSTNKSIKNFLLFAGKTFVGNDFFFTISFEKNFVNLHFLPLKYHEIEEGHLI